MKKTILGQRCHHRRSIIDSKKEDGPVVEFESVADADADANGRIRARSVSDKDFRDGGRSKHKPHCVVEQGRH